MNLKRKKFLEHQQIAEWNHVKEALSLLDRVHLFGLQKEGDGSLQYAIEDIINMVEGITIRLKKQTLNFFFFSSLCVFYNSLWCTGVKELKVFLS